MRIEILLKDASQPKKYDDVKDVFQEGNLLCVLMEDKIDKYNMSNVYRVREYLTQIEPPQLPNPPKGITRI